MTFARARRARRRQRHRQASCRSSVTHGGSVDREVRRVQAGGRCRRRPRRASEFATEIATAFRFWYRSWGCAPCKHRVDVRSADGCIRVERPASRCSGRHGPAATTHQRSRFPVPVPVDVKYASAAPAPPRTIAPATTTASTFLLRNFFTDISLVFGCCWTRAPGSPLAPPKPGDQLRPGDHHVAQLPGIRRTPVCAVRAGRGLQPRPHAPAHFAEP